MVEVVLEGGKKAWQQAGAKPGLIVAEGVFELDGKTCPCSLGFCDEGACAGFVESHAGEA